MRDSVKESTIFSGEKTTEDRQNSGTVCPKCGGKMVVSTHQVAAKYPAPAVEKQVCEESSCNYFRFVKLDRETGLTSSGVRAGELK